MAKTVIENWVDWSKSFVDYDGSFYCGTTQEQKDKAAEIAKHADVWIYSTDVHPRTSSEFEVNGGLYPAHNLVKKDWYDLAGLGVAPEKTVSPELTSTLYEIVRDKSSGLIVPRHVFFQDYSGGVPKPCFSFEDVEETFGVKKLSPAAFLDGEIKYVVNAKHMFNGAGLQSTEWIRSKYGDMSGVPSIEMNAYTLLKEKYGQGEDLVINHTGVVTGICIYQTATGVKQIFPKAEVNIISDGTTQLLISQLGFGDKDTADLAVKKMCQQLGVNYISSAEYFGRLSR